MGLHEDSLSNDARHLLDLFELLYHWHDGDQRIVKAEVEEEYVAGCSDSLIASYSQLRGKFLRGRHESNASAFLGDAFMLAQLCVVELDPANTQQCRAIGELLLPNFAHAPQESIGRRWLEDATATAWGIAVPMSADRQR